jgi:hypothetical protein
MLKEKMRRARQEYKGKAIKLESDLKFAVTSNKKDLICQIWCR